MIAFVGLRLSFQINAKFRQTRINNYNILISNQVTVATTKYFFKDKTLKTVPKRVNTITRIIT